MLKRDQFQAMRNDVLNNIELIYLEDDGTQESWTTAEKAFNWFSDFALEMMPYFCELGIAANAYLETPTADALTTLKDAIDKMTTNEQNNLVKFK